MNTQTINQSIDTDVLHRAIDNACNRVSPAWPLDQSIAVNPWWHCRDNHINEVSAKLKAMGDVDMLMPKSYYLHLFNTQLTHEHLERAKDDLGSNSSTEDLLNFLYQEDPDHIFQWRHMGELLDMDPARSHKMPWHDEIVQQISQFCALYFEYPEQMKSDGTFENGLYQSWRQVIVKDKGIAILMDEPSFNQQISSLPLTLDHVITCFCDEFCMDVFSEDALSEYIYSLLLDIHGWSSWMAYQSWQAQLDGESNQFLKQLVAIRLAWELMLLRHSKTQSDKPDNILNILFVKQFEVFYHSKMQWTQHQSKLWVWQRALEYSYQEDLQNKLVANSGLPIKQPRLQAAFCIDVRSEPMRRALESEDASIETYGFAGFFGLPIAYGEAGSSALTPQLPGLLKASIVVKQRPSQKSPSIFKTKISWRAVAESSPSAFGFVESFGIFKLASLFSPSKSRYSKALNEETWEIFKDEALISINEIASIVSEILRSIGLVGKFSKYVLLVGHGSNSTNNPHASGLDCGACGGQSGEVNVRVLAQILNDKAVRAELNNLNQEIPQDTFFVAALHNTTTDEISVFNHDLPEEIISWLKSAQYKAQEKRASKFNLKASSPEGLNKLFEKKGKNWAELRPEWGLANNASLIIGPRYLTRDVDLEGRSFLHEYNSESDPDAKLLEQIMLAPMVVTNWINLQYYASVTDNRLYGSGNKMLHNVVAEHIGVFEGNGGDLRIGLPIQSIHDGNAWRHQPLRLSVYIVAPKDFIAKIIERHQTIQSLVNNEWLFIIQYDPEHASFWQYKNAGWIQITFEK